VRAMTQRDARRRRLEGSSSSAEERFLGFAI
jgi:hypothetical protein